jgi:HK97 family phage portal protein
MGLFSPLLNLLGVKRQEIAYYSGPSIFRFLPEGLSLTTDQQLSVGAAYGCVRAIVDPLAASDWEVYVREGTKRTNLTDSETFYRLNLRANRNLPAVAAKELLITAALLHGDGYALVLRDNARRVIGWDPLDSTRMKKAWLNDPEAIGGGYIVYEYTQEDGSTVVIPDFDVIHLRGPSVRSLFGGDSLLARATAAIATASAQERFGQHYFARGAHLGGYIKLKGRLRTPEDVARLKADWDSKYAGVGKAGDTAVLEDGAEFQSLTPDAEKIQLVAPRAFQVEDIARFFGVPLVKLQVKEAASGYGSNLATLNEQFSRDCLTPWAKRIAQEIGFKLLPQRAPWPEVSVNLAWLTRGDAESRARVRQMDIQAGVITRDEARADEGLSALPGGVGSIPTTTGAVIALTKEALEPKPPPAPFAPPPPAPPDDPEDPEDPEFENLLRAGLILALDNHARRWRARVKDIPEEKTPEAREELRAKLTKELAAFSKYLPADSFARIASEVEGGVPPEKALSSIKVTP